MAEHSAPSTEQILKSMAALFNDSRQYDAKPLHAAYAASLMRLGIKLATERRLASK